MMLEAKRALATWGKVVRHFFQSAQIGLLQKLEYGLFLIFHGEKFDGEQ